MQFSSALLALFVASGALAAPSQRSGKDTTITVILQNQATELGTQTTLQSGFRDTKAPVGSSGPFSTIELKVGKDVVNRDAYRCAIYDKDNKPIVATRGENVDVTFSDAGKGEWTFKKPSFVSSIICDPTFKKIGPEGKEIRVILQDQATETGSQTVFAENDKTPKAPVGSSGPYQTIEIQVGAIVENQGYRCQALDKHNKPIVAVRGKNVDTTFSDADKGEWTFKHRSEVKAIICDPTFVAKPQ